MIILISKNMKKIMYFLLLFFAQILFGQVVQLVDSKTNESVNFKIVPSLSAGAKLDNVLFASKGGKYYKRVTGNEIRASWFGVVGDGVTDDTKALKAFFNSIQYSDGKVFLVDRENIKISDSVVIDPKSNISIKFLAQVKSIGNGSLVVRPSGNPVNVRIDNINNSRIERATLADNKTGVVIGDLNNSYINIGSVNNFSRGVLFYGKNYNGAFSYNTVYFGIIHDNYYNVELRSYGAGYLNENNFFGGSFNHSSDYANLPTINLFMNTSYERRSYMNNNKFFNQSFEDNKSNQIAVHFSGIFNLLSNPRLENPSIEQTYKVILDASSSYCRVLGSRGIATSNVEDLGYGNNILGSDYSINKISSTHGNEYTNLYSDGADVFSFIGNNGVKYGSISGDGFFKARSLYSDNGFFALTSSGSKTDRGIVYGYGVPTLTLENGSIYIDVNGTAGNVFYFREAGNWVKK